VARTTGPTGAFVETNPEAAVNQPCHVGTAQSEPRAAGGLSRYGTNADTTRVAHVLRS